jgi:signal transduction histidine kinase
VHALVDPGSHADRPVARREERLQESARLQRQINHDIRHEVATIALLASLLCGADDVGPRGRRMAEELLGEAQLLRQLLFAADRSLSGVESTVRSAGPVRLDIIAADVVIAGRLSTRAKIRIEAREAYARVDALAFWRAVRNLVGNAARAAGPAGEVRVAVRADGEWTVIQIDDDGPGFGRCEPGTSALGIGVARDIADAAGGTLEFGRGSLGGCCARLRLPAALPVPLTDGTSG